MRETHTLPSDSILAVKPVSDNFPSMQSTTAKKLAAVEERLTELSLLGKKVKKLEKEVASLSKKIEAPKDWRLMVGRLADTRIAREADALGREIRRNQTDL